jgi:hypothetical protein
MNSQLLIFPIFRGEVRETFSCCGAELPQVPGNKEKGYSLMRA